MIPIDKGAIKSEFKDKVVELLFELCGGVRGLILPREDVGMVHAALVPSERRHCEADGTGTGRLQELVSGLVCLYTE